MPASAYLLSPILPSLSFLSVHVLPLVLVRNLLRLLYPSVPVTAHREFWSPSPSVSDVLPTPIPGNSQHTLDLKHTSPAQPISGNTPTISPAFSCIQASGVPTNLYLLPEKSNPLHASMNSHSPLRDAVGAAVCGLGRVGYQGWDSANIADWIRGD